MTKEGKRELHDGRKTKGRKEKRDTGSAIEREREWERVHCSAAAVALTLSCLLWIRCSFVEDGFLFFCVIHLYFPLFWKDCMSSVTTWIFSHFWAFSDQIMLKFSIRCVWVCLECAGHFACLMCFYKALIYILFREGLWCRGATFTTDSKHKVFYFDMNCVRLVLNFVFFQWLENSNPSFFVFSLLSVCLSLYLSLQSQWAKGDL